MTCALHEGKLCGISLTKQSNDVRLTCISTSNIRSVIVNRWLHPFLPLYPWSSINPAMHNFWPFLELPPRSVPGASDCTKQFAALPVISQASTRFCRRMGTYLPSTSLLPRRASRDPMGPWRVGHNYSICSRKVLADQQWHFMRWQFRTPLRPFNNFFKHSVPPAVTFGKRISVVLFANEHFGQSGPYQWCQGSLQTWLAKQLCWTISGSTCILCACLCDRICMLI